MILGKKIWWFWVDVKEEEEGEEESELEKLSGVLIEGFESLFTKQFVHLIWIAKIHRIKAGAASVIQAGPIWKVMGSCHIN